MNEFVKARWMDRVIKEEAWGVAQLFDGEKLSPFGILCEVAGEKIEVGMQVAWQCLGETMVPPKKVLEKVGITWEQAQDFTEYYMYESTGAQDVADHIMEVFGEQD